ncbi:bifunctional RNase H/acid phosphatase [compost metagenome]
MSTYIYFVRHGESPKTEGNERTRGLTDKGILDAQHVTELLKDEGIDFFISSPYNRAVLTIEELARLAEKEVIVIEDLRELVFIGEDEIYPDNELHSLVTRMFLQQEFYLPGGESINTCRNRAMTAFKDILSKYNGKKVVIGTHGLIMTLIMGHFNPQYNVDFLLKTSKPDIYRMEFKNEMLIETKRLWIK